MNSVELANRILNSGSQGQWGKYIREEIADTGDLELFINRNYPQYSVVYAYHCVHENGVIGDDRALLLNPYTHEEMRVWNSPDGWRKS